MRSWAVIARKEIKEQLRTRKMLITLIVTPIVMWVMVGFIHALMFGMMAPQGPMATPLDLYLTVEDDGLYAQEALKAIRNVSSIMNVRIHNVSSDEGMRLVEEGDITLYVRIPANFTRELEENGRSTLEVWVDVTSTRARAVAAAITNAVREAVEERLREVDVLERPIRVVPFTLLMISFMLIFSALWGPMPVITTSFAGEREKKTLEVLLVTPVKRTSILLGKLLAAGFAAGVYLASNIVGLAIYNAMVLWTTSGIAQQVALAMTSLTLTLDQALVVILAALLSVLLSASIGIVISCFARTVKDAESRYSAIMMVPLMLTMGIFYARLEELPLTLQIIILAIPFSHGVLMVQRSLIYGQPWHLTILSALYMLAWTIGALVAGAKLFEREEIVETRKIRRPRERLPLLRRLRKMGKRGALRLALAIAIPVIFMLLAILG